MPVIVTVAPTAPLVGESDVIAGADTTVNDAPLLAAPSTVTTMLPVVAPLGTGTVMLVSVHAVGVPATPLNVTELVPFEAPNAEPAITTDVPTGPEAGVTLVMTGGVPLESV